MNSYWKYILVGAIAFFLGAAITVSAAKPSRAGGSLIIANCSINSIEERVYSPGGTRRSPDSNHAHPIPGDGKLTSLAVNPTTQGLPLLDGDTIVTVLVNGADTDLEIIIEPGSSEVKVLTLDVPVSTGDLVTLRTDALLSTTGQQRCYATYEYKRK